MLPAETKQSAAPFFTRSTATAIDEWRLERTAEAGCSPISMTSGAWTIWQQVLDAGQVALLAEGGADVGLAADELNLVAPGARGAHGAGDRRQWCADRHPWHPARREPCGCLLWPRKTLLSKA